MKLDSAVTACTHEVEKYCLISKTKYRKNTRIRKSNQFNNLPKTALLK